MICLALAWWLVVIEALAQSATRRTQRREKRFSEVEPTDDSETADAAERWLREEIRQ